MGTRININEFELLQRFVNGDDRAFSEIYNEFYFAIYNHALRWLADDKDAEDITADTFVKLWNRRQKFSSKQEIAGFLHLTVRNGCIDFLKHHQVKIKNQDALTHMYQMNEKLGQDAAEIWEEFAKLVYAEVAKMPARMRDIFMLSYEQGLKPAEIAQKLNISVQTVSNQKYAAINILKTVAGNNARVLLILTLLSKDF